MILRVPIIMDIFTLMKYSVEEMLLPGKDAVTEIHEEKNMAETVRVLVEEEEVDKRIRDLGEQLGKDYEGKEVHLICVLKGGVFFMCELAKRITVPVSMDFMSVSSYGDGTASSGVVKIAKDLDETLEEKMF